MVKKKVLFIMQSLQGGGAERVTLDVIKHLDRSKFEPSILVVNYFGSLTSSIPENVNVIKVLTGKEKTIFNLFKVIRTVIKAAKNMDLIIGSLEMTPTYLASLASLLTKKHAIGWIHINVQKYDKTNSAIHRFLINRLYKRLNAIVAVSNGVKSSFEEMFPKINVPVIRIYNPIRIEEIDSMVKEENDLDEIREPIILSAGRLTEAKSFDDLLRAHKYLLDHNVKNKLIILGEGEQREYLENLIRKLNIQDSVILKGFVQNPYKYMRSARVFVLSSKYEGFSVVVAEALSIGIPIVSTDCPSGPSEILENGKYGLLSSINDYKALAINIMATLNNDEDDIHRNLRKRRANDFSIGKIILEFEELFLGILDNDKNFLSEGNKKKVGA